MIRAVHAEITRLAVDAANSSPLRETVHGSLGNDTSLREVIFCCFSQSVLEIYESLLHETD